MPSAVCIISYRRVSERRFCPAESCSTNLLFYLPHTRIYTTTYAYSTMLETCIFLTCLRQLSQILFLSLSHTHTQRIWQKMGVLWAEWYDSLLTPHLSIRWCSYSQQFMTGENDLFWILLYTRTHNSGLLFCFSCVLLLFIIFHWQTKHLRYCICNFFVLAQCLNDLIIIHLHSYHPEGHFSYCID